MDNPYSAPSSNPTGRESLGFGQEGVTQGVVSQLARTKGWVRFLGVLGLIGAGLMMLVGFGVLAAGSTFQKMFASQAGMPGSGFFFALGIGYLLFGLLFFYPSLKLNSYASAIGSLIYTGRSEDLEAAIEHQRAYWKFVGVILVLMLLFSVAMIGVGVVAATAVGGGLKP
jgi:hypothetical protein